MATSNIGQLLVQGAIGGFVPQLAPLAAFSTNFSANELKKDDVAKVFYVTSSVGSVENFSYSTGDSGDAAFVAGKDVTLDIFKTGRIPLTDADLGKMSPEAVTLLGSKVGEQVGAAVQTAVFAHFTGSVYTTNTNTVATGSALATEDGWLAVREQVVGLWGSTADASIIAKPALYKKLLKLSINANEAGTAEPRTEGQVRRYLGFNLYESNYLPANIVGVVVNPRALGIATSDNTAVDSQLFLSLEKMADPGGSGISISLGKYADPAKETMLYRVRALAGADTIDTAAAVLINS